MYFMKVQLECVDDIWLQVTIPDKVTVDSFLEKVSQIEHIIARDRKHHHEPLPAFEEHQQKRGVDGRLDHLERSTQRIIELLDGMHQS
jgi:hypothetical protein